MAAPMQKFVDDVPSPSTCKNLDWKKISDGNDSTKYDGKSRQDLLETIQKLQSQLAALQKTQESIPCTASSSQPNIQGQPPASVESQTVTEGARKRAAEGFQMLAPTGSVIKKKGKKEKKLKPFDFTRYNKRHVALLIAYLGWDYQGFASQSTTENTIEAYLFDALTKTRLIENRASSNYSRCGRTDKGVSAFGQVVALDLRSNLLEGHGVIQRSDNKPKERLGNKDVELDYAKFLNRVLPENIRVLAWSSVDVNFSARFDCLHRTYKYFFPKGDLDIEAMQKAAKKLVGQHDFRNLCKMDIANGVVNFVRRILDVDISPVNESCGGYQMYVVQVKGQAFLYHQVRCMMAILFLVGQHKEEPEIIDRLLDIDKQPCKPQYTMAVDHPLVLYQCGFDGVKWNYEKDELEVNMSRFQSMWTNYSIRQTTLRTMLNDLVKAPIPSNAEDGTKQESTDLVPWDSKNPALLKQNSHLVLGVYSKVYKPLLQRPVGDSLEDRIRHHSKKLKLDESAKT